MCFIQKIIYLIRTRAKVGLEQYLKYQKNKYKFMP